MSTAPPHPTSPHLTPHHPLPQVELRGLKMMETVCTERSCILCPHKKRSNPVFRRVQAGVDVAIATRCMQLLMGRDGGARQRLILLAGDGDFVPVLEYVNTKQTRQALRQR